MLMYPVYRLGIVLSSSQQLDRKQGLDVAFDIEKNAAEFEELIRQELEERGFASVRRAAVNRSRQATKLRLWPTIVIDFPKFTCEFKKNKVDVRACVTVCTDEGQSKCWIRVNFLEVGISDKNFDGYFDELESICREILKRVSDRYKDSIEVILQTEISIKQEFEIKIRSASDSNGDLEEYFVAFYDEGVTYNADIHAKLAKRIGAKIQRMDNAFTEIPPPNGVHEVGDSTLRAFGYAALRSPMREDAKFLTHRVPAVCFIRYDDAGADLVGLGIDKLGSALKPLESASHVVSSSLAGEYGELF